MAGNVKKQRGRALYVTQRVRTGYFRVPSVADPIEILSECLPGTFALTGRQCRDGLRSATYPRCLSGHRDGYCSIRIKSSAAGYAGEWCGRAPCESKNVRGLAIRRGALFPTLCYRLLKNLYTS